MNITLPLKSQFTPKSSPKQAFAEKPSFLYNLLYIEENRITDLSPLAGLINLKELNLYDNKISDLASLAELTNLEGLGLDINRVLDLSPLVGLTNLKELDVRSNPLNLQTITTDVPILETKGVYVIHSYR